MCMSREEKATGTEASGPPRKTPGSGALELLQSKRKKEVKY